jgi:hypothetical protein
MARLLTMALTTMKMMATETLTLLLHITANSQCWLQLLQPRMQEWKMTSTTMVVQVLLVMVMSLEGVNYVFDLNELIISIAHKQVNWKPHPTDSE